MSGRILCRFAVLADTHIEPEAGPEAPRSNRRARAAVEAINRVRPAFVIHLGDVVHPIPEAPGRDAALEAADRILGGLASPLHVTPGNHDIGDKPLPWMPAKSVRPAWLEAFEHRHGSAGVIDRGTFRCLLFPSPLLNSGLDAEAAARARIEAVLEDGGAARAFLFTHYPPWLLEPGEPGHYDNLDRPGRDWLMALLRRYRIEALFAGHVHTRFRHPAGPTLIHVAPATSFARRDYSELAPIGPAAEFGRDDAAKLGFLVVEVLEAGHRVRFLRLAEPDAPEALPNPRLGAFLRHPLAPVVEIPANPPTDALQRRRVRDDHPLLAIEELGLGVLRVPAEDLLDPQTRARMALLAAAGVRFLVLGYGLPAPGLGALLARHRSMILGYEAVLSDADLDRARSLRPRLGVPLRLAPLSSSAAAPGGSGQRAQRVGFGFGAAELDRLTALDLKRDEVFVGVVAALGADEPVFSTLLRTVAAASARELDLSVGIEALGRTPEDAVRDEAMLGARAAEAAFAARALPDAEILLDTLIDVDRGYYPRHGLLDRRCDLRLAGRAVRTVNALPPLRAGGFAWSLADPSGAGVHGYESEGGIELLITAAVEPRGVAFPHGEYGQGQRAGDAAAARRLGELRLPVAPGPEGEATALALDGRPVAKARYRTTAADPRRVAFDPPLELAAPLIVRLRRESRGQPAAGAVTPCSAAVAS